MLLGNTTSVARLIPPLCCLHFYCAVVVYNSIKLQPEECAVYCTFNMQDKNNANLVKLMCCLEESLAVDYRRISTRILVLIVGRMGTIAN